MEDLVIFYGEGIGVFKFMALLAAGSSAAAYAMLSRGVAAGLITISLISFAWAWWLGAGEPPVAVFTFWFIMNFVYTLAFIGLIRVSAMLQSGRLRIFGSDLIGTDTD